MIDAGTGAVLAQHSGDGLKGAVFTEVDVDVTDPGMFTWDGPVETDRDSRRKNQQREHDTWWERMEWFRENVTTAELATPVLTDFTPHSVEIADRETGEFTARLGPGEGTGWVARRPRSRKTWLIDRHGHLEAWSTRDFDWAFSAFRGALDPDALHRLQQQLHPGRPVIGTPDVHQPSRPDA